METWSYITQELQSKHPDLAYVHFTEAREVGLRDEAEENKKETLDPFREIWKGPFITAGGFLIIWLLLAVFLLLILIWLNVYDITGPSINTTDQRFTLLDLKDT